MPKKMKTKHYYLTFRNQMKIKKKKIKNKIHCLTFKIKTNSNNLISKMNNKMMMTKTNLILKKKVPNWLRLIM